MNDWTNDIKRLVSDKEVKAPDGLLDDIKAEMSRRGLSALPSAPSHKAKLIPLKSLRWVAVAAAVVAFAIPVVWRLLPDAKEQIAKVMSRHSAQSTASAPLKGQALLPSATNILALSSAKQTNNNSPIVYDSTNVVISDNAMADGHEACPNKEGEDNIQDGKENNSNKKNVTEPNAIKRRPRYDDSADLLAYEAPQRKSSRGFSVNAYYGGSTGSGSSLDMGGNMVMSDAEPYGLYSLDMTAANSNGFMDAPKRERKAHHKQPIKVGVSVGYRLDDRWSVNTGVTYSYLSSDFTADGAPTQTQKLHYVGIPLTASYSFVRTRKAEVYVTGGGEVEKLVKGSKAYEDYDDEKVRESRPQWSVKAAVGGAYHINPSVSVYAEPGVSYYFDNHSGVDNVYKDRPTSFSLNLGVRINVNK